MVKTEMKMRMGKTKQEIKDRDSITNKKQIIVTESSQQRVVFVTQDDDVFMEQSSPMIKNVN